MQPVRSRARKGLSPAQMRGVNNVTRPAASLSEMKGSFLAFASIRFLGGFSPFFLWTRDGGILFV